jgi:hypothetical protein
MAPVVPPPLPEAVAAPAAAARDDVRPFVRSMVEQALAPMDRRMREMQLRLEQLENRPVPAPAVVAAPAPAAMYPRTYSNPQINRTAGPTLDIAAIERSVKLGPEMDQFNGRRRRVRLALAVAFACLVVFGGLFLALAESYTHTHG